MPKIYYSPLSTAASRVRMCAEAIGLDYEPIAVDLRRGEQRSADCLEINPFGKVPVIDDDGFCLFESNAIMKCLCCKSGSDLYPDTCKGRAIADLALLATIDPSEAVDIELSTYAALSTWREKLRAKPFYRAVHSFYGEGVLEPAAT